MKGKFVFIFIEVLLLCNVVLFLLYIKVNQPHVCIYPLSFGFPSHSGNHGALSSGVPCAMQ